MGNVFAVGGGDCPEVSIGAIKKALESSLPHSYVYVFTDAPAKDYHLISDVITLVQQKKTQVVFIITEGCIDAKSQDYKYYEKIAETSSGQIYNLKKKEVEEVRPEMKTIFKPVAFKSSLLLLSSGIEIR